MTSEIRAHQRGRYRAVSQAAVASLVCGMLSPMTMAHWSFGLIPAAGIALATRATRRIRQAPAELTGLPLAKAGLWLSIVFGLLGYGWLLFSRVKEVPYGYHRVTYTMLQPNPDVPGEKVPPAVFDLQPTLNDDKKVFIKGYISPTRQQTGLKQFILCPAIANCPFCTPDPKPTEMIHVVLEGDLTTNYTTHLVRLGGRFRVNPQSPNGIPYRLDVDYLR